MPAHSDMSIRDWYSHMEEILGDVLEHQDFSMQTWLALGAALQLLALAWLPVKLSFWLPLAWLAYRMIRTASDTLNVRESKLWSRVLRGRWMGQYSESENPIEAGETSEGIVMFLLGARLNHPLGKFGPGAVEVNEVFNNMWREAEQNRSKWGYLGRTATLVDFSDSESTPTIWISYWKDLKGLQQFSEGTAHRLGRDMYNGNKLPYIGIMHETYYAPKGCWETIYDNMPPWGQGTIKPLKNGDSSNIKPVDVLKKSSRGSTMFRRMGRGIDGIRLKQG